jgi:hypothetical protein
MVYMGNTCVLQIGINTDRSYIDLCSHPTYSHDFIRKHKFSEFGEGLVAKYLADTASKVKSKFYGNQKEGYFQNLTCMKHGEKSNSNSPFYVSDRECVVAFNNQVEKSDCIEPIQSRYMEIRESHQALHPIIFGKPNKKPFGNECDMIGIDGECNLHCIELKHGSNTTDIYWGPLQVAVYKDIFESIDPALLFRDVAKLLYQKVKLGLLPMRLLSILEGRNKFNSIISDLLIAEPNYDSTCWEKMRTIIMSAPETLTCKILNMDTNGTISVRH